MATRFKNGLVLGKFMPPTMGHKYLIDTAAKQCELLYVMICSDKTQPIEGKRRFTWLLQMYHDVPNVVIRWCQDVNPQYPHEAESLDIFYNKYWVPSVRKHTKDIEVVFTSEDYGDEFAEYLGVEHVSVDQPRSVVPISATKIRETPLKYWDYIPDVVKSYFMKKVVILGPESTGKSTLTEKLAKHFNGEWVEEYGRTYTAVTGTNNLGIMDFNYIGQVHASQIANARATSTKKYLFSDTEAITTKAFGKMYLTSDVDYSTLDNIIDKQDFDLYILLDIDVPWVDDGTRDFPKERLKHITLLKSELVRQKVNYVLISGNYDERFEKAVELIENL